MTSRDDFAFAKLDRLAARSLKRTLAETDRLAALKIIESERVPVALPLKKARRFARALNLPEPESCIVPLILGEAEAALAASTSLAEAGYLVTAIRPSTVLEGSARLRFTFTAGHDDTKVEQLAEAVSGLVPAAA